MDSAEGESALLQDLRRADSECAVLLEELWAQSPTAGPDLHHPCWSPDADATVPHPTFQHTLDIGRLIMSRFEIKGFLGSGGFGEVYRAYDRQQRIDIALKTLRMGLAFDQSAIASLRNEVNMARLVTHVNVCRIYEFHWDSAEAIPFVTMELLEGETLAQRLRRDGRLSQDAALPIVHQMLAALDAAHQNAIIHRDFKSANVMLTRGRRVIVMDFGLAREVRRGHDLRSTLLTNNIVGTPGYMAPEQLRGERATVASDIHALGVVLFEMVTGRRPFEGANPLEIASRRLHEDAPSPRRYNRKLDRRWEHTILHCLQRDPARRLSSIAKVRECFAKRPPLLPPSRRAVLGGGAAVTVTGLLGGKYVLTPKQAAVVEVFDIENRSQEAGFDYLSKGTTSEIVRRLAQVSGITVMRAHAARSQSAPHSASRFAFSGAVQAEQGEVRLKVRLEETATGRIIWERSFDRTRFDNLLEVQAEIASGATAKLKEHVLASATLVARDSNTALSAPTQSSQAFHFYLRGTSLLQEASPETLRAAIDHFERAVQQDPQFALAYASLAEAHIMLRSFGYLPEPQLIEAARRYAEKAVELNPNLADGYNALAAIKQMEWDWKASEQLYDTALRLQPTFPRAHRWRGGLVLQFARFQEAIDEMETAHEQDPYDRSTVAVHGLAYLFADRCNEAVAVLERGIADRDLPVARWNLCQAYARLGHHARGGTAAEFFRKALAEAERVQTIERRSPAIPSALSVYMFSLVHSIRKDIVKAQPCLEHLAQAVAEGRSSPIHLAMAYACQENITAALQLVERAVLSHDRSVLYLRVNVFLESLRNQPQFEAVLRKLRLK